jgi:MoaA/NifB/PqqE/SkfB family radical SAM enzyme
MNLVAQTQTLLRNLSWHLDFPLVGPRKVIFLLTNRCPLRCVMCWTHEADLHNELPLSSWEKAVDSLPQLGVHEIMFSGGEVLLRKDDVVALVDRACHLGIRTSVITSGWKTTPTVMQELYDAGLNVMMNSIDGPNAEIHDGIRKRPGSFDSVIASMDMVAEIRGRPRPHIRDPLLRNDFAYGTMSVIMDQNCHMLTDIYDVSASHGAQFICFQAVTNDEKNQKNKVQTENLPVLREQIEKLIAIKKTGGPIAVTDTFLRSIPQYFEDPASLLTDVQCMAGFNDFIINAQGHVSTCFGDIKDPDVTGILNTEVDVAKLWRMAPMNETRARMRTCENPCFVACWTNG